MKQPRQLIVEPTADGSATLYIPEMDEHYHSVKGAVVEARHVYVETALHASGATPVRVLEVGFGTGLNAFLTAIDAQQCQRPVIYTSLELYPVSEAYILQLGYPELIAPEYAALFYDLHKASWGESVEISPYFTVQKKCVDLLRFQSDELYDVIYFDAFAPEKQPELWTEAVFQTLFAVLRPTGVLSTYCAKGEVRRRMQRAGFTVERLAGPPEGKREILRAKKPY